MKLYTGSCEKRAKKVVKKAPKKCKVVQNCIFQIDLGVQGAGLVLRKVRIPEQALTIYTFVMYEGVKEMREERKNLYSCPGLDEACGLACGA